MTFGLDFFGAPGLCSEDKLRLKGARGDDLFKVHPVPPTIYR
jgi:hypothetical protein